MRNLKLLGVPVSLTYYLEMCLLASGKILLHEIFFVYF